ncbi:MAG: tyrosine-type recombinase/integrase, partial [Cyanobacteria bacterium J06635_11]
MTKRRGRRGGVSVSPRGGILRLRWTQYGKQQQLSLRIPDTPLNRVIATQLATQMELDFLTGKFDETLIRYQVPESQAEKIQPTASTTDLFKQFTEEKRLDGVSGQTISTKYQALCSNIQRFGRDILTTDDARELFRMICGRQAPRTANQNLVLLKCFGDWLAKNGELPENPFEAVKSAKSSSQKVQDRTPFTKDELALLLATMKEHPHARHYYDFTVVLFSLGLRPSEAIGLRWSHINLKRREVTICETMARSETGISSGSSRVRKGTKTGDVRILDMNDRLFQLFTARQPSPVALDDLVFTTPKGLPICDRRYRTRYWKPVCQQAGIRYRPPYTARHTLLTYGL